MSQEECVIQLPYVVLTQTQGTDHDSQVSCCQKKSTASGVEPPLGKRQISTLPTASRHIVWKHCIPNIGRLRAHNCVVLESSPDTVISISPTLRLADPEIELCKISDAMTAPALYTRHILHTCVAWLLALHNFCQMWLHPCSCLSSHLCSFIFCYLCACCSSLRRPSTIAMYAQLRRLPGSRFDSQTDAGGHYNTAIKAEQLEYPYELRPGFSW